ncbi:3892_t:CDS:2, partial [Dentiscutata heterogama]
EQAKNSHDKPAQIVQDAIMSSPQNVYPYLPSSNSIRQTIHRVRHIDLSTEPSSLENLFIPENMKTILNGLEFLISDSVVGQGRILVFTTVDNVRHLSRSRFWLMDGTFKTVPTFFRQLYTIHGCVGGNENSRVMPLVFALMSSKSEEFYRRLFQRLIDFGEEYGIYLSPQVVLTDFEMAAISAIQLEFEEVQ